MSSSRFHFYHLDFSLGKFSDAARSVWFVETFAQYYRRFDARSSEGELCLTLRPPLGAVARHAPLCAGGADGLELGLLAA